MAVREEGSPQKINSGLDRLLEHRTRLAALVLLTHFDELSFVRLRDDLGETDGNLGAHLRKLEEAGYIDVRKEFQGRKPITWYSITNRGREALRKHLATLERLIQEAKV